MTGRFGSVVQTGQTSFRLASNTVVGLRKYWVSKLRVHT